MYLPMYANLFNVVHFNKTFQKIEDDVHFLEQTHLQQYQCPNYQPFAC